jgi:hypothetical protein
MVFALNTFPNAHEVSTLRMLRMNTNLQLKLSKLVHVNLCEGIFFVFSY